MQESREDVFNPNLLNDLERTLKLIKEVEGESWYRSYSKDVRIMAEKVKSMASSNIDPQVIVGDFYGNGGVTRWMVMANGDVAFSTFYDTGDREKNKTKKAKSLGFKLV